MVVVASGLVLKSPLEVGDMGRGDDEVGMNNTGSFDFLELIKSLVDGQAGPVGPPSKATVPGLIAPAQGFAIPGIANTPAFVKALIKNETGSYTDPFTFTRCRDSHHLQYRV